MADTSVIFSIIGKDKASGVMKGIGNAATSMFSAFAVGKVFDIGRDAINSASDLAETQSKVNVLFGEGAGAVDKWADAAGNAFGQSKQQALDAASTFAIFGKSAGLSGQNLVGFSQDLTALATDMASFSNTSVQQSIDAIGAALRGESEPIRAYGVLLDDASLKAKALELGLAKGTSSTNEIKAAQVSALSAQKAYNDAVAKHGKDSLEAQKASVALTNAQGKLKSVTEGTIAVLTPQQRVLAAQALIMEQTTAAQGDFSRTSSGLANQQRIMAAQFENAKASLGAGLLPLMLKFTSGLVSVIGFVQANKGWLTPLAIGLGVVAVAIWAVTTAQTAWNIAMTLNPIGLIIVAVIGLIAAIVYLWTHSAAFREFFIGIWNHIWGFLKGVGHWFAHDFAGFFVDAWNWIKNLFIGIVVWEKGWIDKFMAAWHAIPGALKSAFDKVTGFITAPFRAAFNAVAGFWNNTIGRLHWSVPSWVPLIGGSSISAPKLPQLDVGGDVLRSGMAVIHAGERVMPAAQVRSLRGSGGGPVEMRITGNGGLAFLVQQAVRAGDIRLYDSSGQLISVTP